MSNLYQINDQIFDSAHSTEFMWQIIQENMKIKDLERKYRRMKTMKMENMKTEKSTANQHFWLMSGKEK